MQLTDSKKLFNFIGYFFFINALAFWLFGISYLNAILSSDSLFKNSLIDFSSFSGKTFVLIFSLINYFSYMFFLAFIPSILVSLLSLFSSSKRLIISISVLLASITLALLIIDIKVFAIFKFHINWTILEMILNPQASEIFDFSNRELLEIIIVLFLIILGEILAAWVVWKKLAKQSVKGQLIFFVWFSSIIFSYFCLIISVSEKNNLLIQQVSNLPLYYQYITKIIPDENAKDIIRNFSEEHFSQRLFPNSTLHYPLHPLQCVKVKKPPNIIFILVDSLRFDNLDEKKMPELTQFAADNWNFLKHFSGGNATQPGLFSLFYSVPGSYWTAALQQEKRPIIFDIFEKNDYRTRIIWSSEMRSPPFHKTIYKGLPNIWPDAAPRKSIVARDKYITQAARKFLKENKEKGPFFLNIFYDAPHGFCVDNFPLKYPVNDQACTRFQFYKNLDRQEHYNRYLNAVSFIDHQIAILLKEIKKNGYLDNSIILISSDHGQEFNENGHNDWGHATNFTPYQVQIPLVIHWPQESSRVVDYITTSYDIVPTLLQKIFTCKNPTSDYSIGQNLLFKKDRLPFVLTGSYVNMGYIEADKITTLQASGEIRITDLNGNFIPDQKVNKQNFNSVLYLMRKYYVEKRA